MGPFDSYLSSRSIVIGDFNSDGKPDFASAPQYWSYVTVVLGNGNGGFTSPGGPIPTGRAPSSLAVGDFNGDGNQDLAVANFLDNNVTILLGNGTGGFTPASRGPAPAGKGPRAIAVADFNLDGKADLAVANYDGFNVTILLGDGNGAFVQANGSPLPVPASEPGYVVVGDFNQDGKPDLAITPDVGGAVFIFLGNGNGSFVPASGSPLLFSGYVASLTVSDINGDGKSDLVIPNDSFRTITVLLGDGKGGFRMAAGSPFLTGGLGAVFAATGDFNSDGKADLVVLDNSGLTASMWVGDGNGAFARAWVPISLGGAVFSVLVADYNADGKADLALVTAEKTLTVMFGSTPTTTGLAVVPNPATFGEPVTLTATVNPSNATGRIAFYDGTTILGQRDITSGTAAIVTTGLQGGTRSLRAYYAGDTANLASTSMNITLPVNTKPSITFARAPGSSFSSGKFPVAMVTADFNRDRKPDLALANQPNNSVTILLGNGTGSFTEASGSPISAGGMPGSLAVGDFNSDGNIDLVVANFSSNDVALLLGNGTGRFTPAPASPFPAGTNPTSVAAGDFNNDGQPDLIITDNSSYSASVLLGHGNGTLTPGTPYGFAYLVYPVVIALGDLNLDGNADMIVSTSGLRNGVEVGLGHGNGIFTPAGESPFGAGNGPGVMAAGDFNGDGRTDVALPNPFTNNVAVLLGDALVRLKPAIESPFSVGKSPAAAVIADFNGDGKTDLAVANSQSNNVSILLGDGTGGFVSNTPFAVGTDPRSLVVADFNGDGRADLAVANSVSGTVTVLLGSVSAQEACIRDWSGNNRSGVLLYDPASGGQYTGISAGDGTYNFVPGTFTAGFDTLRSGDFNGDSKADVVLYNPHTALAYIGMSTGTGGFNFQSLFWSPGYDFVEPGDLNGDGRTDFALYNSSTATMYTAISNVAGAFTYRYTLISPQYTSLRLADFTADGKADIFVYNASNGSAALGIGDGAGGFTFKPLFISPGYNLIEVGDLNGDGKADLLLYDAAKGNAATGLSDGTGAFGFTPLTFSPGFTSVRLGDWTGDGTADVILFDKNTAAAYLGISDSTGAFNFQSLFWSPGYDSVVPQDVNGDGKMDIVVYNSATGTEYTGISNGKGTFTYTYQYWGIGRMMVR